MDKKEQIIELYYTIVNKMDEDVIAQKRTKVEDQVENLEKFSKIKVIDLVLEKLQKMSNNLSMEKEGFGSQDISRAEVVSRLSSFYFFKDAEKLKNEFSAILKNELNIELSTKEMYSLLSEDDDFKSENWGFVEIFLKREASRRGVDSSRFENTFSIQEEYNNMASEDSLTMEYMENIFGSYGILTNDEYNIAKVVNVFVEEKGFNLIIEPEQELGMVSNITLNGKEKYEIESDFLVVEKINSDGTIDLGSLNDGETYKSIKLEDSLAILLETTVDKLDIQSDEINIKISDIKNNIPNVFIKNEDEMTNEEIIRTNEKERILNKIEVLNDSIEFGGLNNEEISINDIEGI